jgi:hypothetical protein
MRGSAVAVVAAAAARERAVGRRVTRERKGIFLFYLDLTHQT